MDIVNRNPDEVKEREYETTGDKSGTDLPANKKQEVKSENELKSDERVQQKKEGSNANDKKTNT